MRLLNDKSMKNLSKTTPIAVNSGKSNKLEEAASGPNNPSVGNGGSNMLKSILKSKSIRDPSYEDLNSLNKLS